MGYLHSHFLNIKNHLHLDISLNQFNLFTELLMSGVYVKTCFIGKSIYDFLFYELQLDDDFINNRIGTIFLDGMPIDDLFSTKLKRDSRIALSSAMPGLVGAIMRLGSPYASMRQDITYKGTYKENSDCGYIFLKLFNLLINVIGGKILKMGVFIEPLEIIDYLVKKDLLNFSENINLNKQKTTPDKVLSVIKKASNGELVALSVEFL